MNLSGTRHGRDPLSLIGVLLLLVGLLAGCGSKSSLTVSSATTSDSVPTTTVSPTTLSPTTSSPTTTTDPTVTTDTTPAGPACSTYVDLVTKATGAKATLTTPDPSTTWWTCGFQAGSFHGAFFLQAWMTGDIPSAADNLDRSGSWEIDRTEQVGDRQITLRLTNDTGGSDTYPPFAGPPQHDRSVATAVAFMRLLANS